jgi:hypothetical protein
VSVYYYIVCHTCKQQVYADRNHANPLKDAWCTKHTSAFIQAHSGHQHKVELLSEFDMGPFDYIDWDDVSDTHALALFEAAWSYEGDTGADANNEGPKP